MERLTTDPRLAGDHVVAPTSRPIARLQQATGPGALVLGPALTATGFALHPLAATDTAVFIARINAHPARWALAHLLIGVGLAVFAAGAGSALRLAHGRGSRFIGAGVFSAGIGAAAMGYEAIAHGAVGYALAGRADVSLLVSAHVQTAFEHLGFTLATALASILFPAGILSLGVGAIRSPLTPTWGGVLLLVAPIGIQIVGAGPFELIGAAPLLIGMATVASAARSVPIQDTSFDGVR
jgi:hypothetical protein